MDILAMVPNVPLPILRGRRMIPEVVFLQAETRWAEEPEPVEEDDDTQYENDADAWRKGE